MIRIDNFIKLFEGAVRENWERPALSDWRKSTITYGQLAERIETLDLVWKKAGLKRGDKIAINARPSAMGASLYYTAVSKGYVAVELYNAFTPSDTLKLVNHSDSKILYTEKRTFDAMDFEQMPQVLCVIDCISGEILASREAVDGIYAAGPRLLAEKYPEGMKPSDFSVIDVDLDDICAILIPPALLATPRA